ncbi:MupG family TIM beta-alpha barrel fold protein, partial [Enterococcus faecium]|nr:MupG family TIM beta-alpha barrel fold protein [Enterococcus faecium]
YPQRYTGLGLDYFKQTTEQYRKHNLNTAAFVNAPSGNIGPWPLQEEMVSLEEHRGQALFTQIMHLKMLGLIDDVLISNAGVTEEDLKAASEAFKMSMPAFHVIPAPSMTELEHKIVFESQHSYRGDHSDYVLRSTMTRVWYRDEDVPANNPVPIKKGDVLVMNNEYAQYKAETQIALQDLE